MKKITVVAVIAVLALTVMSPWAASPAQADPKGKGACWGQATKVFAKTGVMGEHSSQQGNPRLGLRNLARALFDAGAIEDDSMQALGVFVTDALGLSIAACQ